MFDHYAIDRYFNKESSISDKEEAQFAYADNSDSDEVMQLALHIWHKARPIFGILIHVVANT